ncbi:MAG: YARHG domain-containing protein [Myxococcaceae bacterium]|nr:YARHG domain-containing protein [Myxococcaceae bacterium]
MRALLLAVAVTAAPALADERPLTFTRPLTADDLSGRSLRELTLMRNWIYARRGNEFRRKWLRDFFVAQKWYSADQRAFLSGEWKANSDDGPEVWAREDKNAEMIAEYESALTVEQLVAMRDAARARLKDAKTPDPNDAVELRLLSVRLGGWAGEGAAPADLTPLENPKRLDGLLKLSDLDDLSARDLKLLRNTIFARKGRPFETPLVKGHFKTVQWYSPNPKYADAMLSDLDKKNVKLIQSVERALKRENEQNYMVAA